MVSARDWLMLFVALLIAIGVGLLIYRGGLGHWVRGFRAPSWLRGLAWLEGAFVFLVLACLVQRDAVQKYVPAFAVCGVLVVVGVVCYIAFRVASANTIEH